MMVGGLPQHPEPPLHYQVVYSLEGVLDYYTTPAMVLRDGEIGEVEALSDVVEVDLPGVGRLEAFHTAGGLSTMASRYAGVLEAMEYRTLRYPGHAVVMRAIRDLGLLDREPVQVGAARVTPRDLFLVVAGPRLLRDPRESPDMVLAYHLPGSRTEAHVATSIQCVGRVRVEAIGGGRWAAWLEDLEYVALLDRTRSWWRPRSDQNPEWVLRHEQLRFAVTELAARRRSAQRERDAAALRGVGRSAVEALAAFERAFLAHMDALAAEWEAQQIQYDRETRHGNDVKRQTEWFVRVQRALHASAAAGEG